MSGAACNNDPDFPDDFAISAAFPDGRFIKPPAAEAGRFIEARVADAITGFSLSESLVNSTRHLLLEAIIKQCKA